MGIDGPEGYSRLGLQVDLSADVDGDGVGELILTGIGEPCKAGFPGQSWVLRDRRVWVVSGAAVLDASPSPRIEQFAPDSDTADGGARIVVYGTGFDDDARVFFGGSESSDVDVIGRGVLVATAPTNRLDSTVRIRVESHGRSAESPTVFRYEPVRRHELSASEDSGRFQRIACDPASGVTFSGVVEGDFNGDSMPDLALAVHRLESPTAIQFLFGDGERGPDLDLDGVESPSIAAVLMEQYNLRTTEEYPTIASGGDLDGDGRHDLVVAARHRDSNEDAWFVLFGQNSIENETDLTRYPRTARITSERAGGSGFSIVADVSGDGFDDLLLASAHREGRTSLYILARSA